MSVRPSVSPFTFQPRTTTFRFPSPSAISRQNRTRLYDYAATVNHKTDICLGCLGEFASIIGPSHRYMLSSPGCWEAYGRVLAFHYSEPRLANVHRLAVDAYAAQHPGNPSPQSIKSVGVHLVRLYYALEKGFAVDESNRIMVAATRVKHQFSWLEPPAHRGNVNVSHLDGLEEVSQHAAMVRTWADSVWEAWAGHHDQIAKWAGLIELA